jgi:ADP-ribose pyrophosphatase
VAGRGDQGPGYCNQEGHIFLATELVQGEPAREATEQGMVCRAFLQSEVEAMVRDGTLVDGMSLAALGLLRFKGML